MNKKYKLLTDDKIEVDGHTLYRIEALVDIKSKDVMKGDKGGYIEKESNLSHYDNAWIYSDAKVYGDAMVGGNAKIYWGAEVFDNARVCDNAEVYDNVKIYGDAVVFDNVCVGGNAEVCGNAWVFGNAVLTAKAKFTEGWFIGGGDADGITEITDKTGSDAWEHQYVIGDYKIEYSISDTQPDPEKPETVEQKLDYLIKLLENKY